MSQACQAHKFAKYIEGVPCEVYDERIFKQLPTYEQTYVRGCGVAKMDAFDAFQEMMLDINFLDSYKIKQKGSPFEYKGDFERVFLKSAEVPTKDKLMDIPQNTEEQKKQTHLSFALTQPPNNKGSQSLFLFMREQDTVNYKNLLFNCKPPPTPPPTIPELLAKQEKVIQGLAEEQDSLLTLIYDMIQFKKDKLKELAIASDIVVKDRYKDLLKDVRNENLFEKDEKKIIQRYESYTLKLFSALKEKESITVDLQEAETTLTKLQTKASRFSLYDFTIGRFIPYDDKELTKNLTERIKNYKLQIAKYTMFIQDLKTKVDLFYSKTPPYLPPWYIKSDIANSVETTMGIVPTNYTDAEKADYEASKIKHTTDCTALADIEKTAEESTYNTIIKYMNYCKYYTSLEIQRGILNNETNPTVKVSKQILLNFMIGLPSPGTGAFNQYKEMWSNENCAPSKYYMPPLGKDKNTTILLPTFDSFLDLILRYRATQIKTIQDVLTNR